MTQIFPNGTNLANQSIQNIVVTECNAIESAILYASNNQLVDVIITGTIMTSTTIGTWANITSVNVGSSLFTLDANGFTTGQEIMLQAVGTGGTLASPLLADTIYYTIPIDANDFQLASNYINAIQAAPIILLNGGSGTQQIELLSASQQYALVWTNQVNDRSKRLQMYEVIQYFTDKSYQIYPQLSQVTNYATLEWHVSW